VVEEKRPGQYLPLREDEHGTYIFNSRDLCMIEHIPALIESGIAALKIEGRMKGIHYVATTVKAYREAIDAYYRQPEGYRVARDWRAALDSVNQRGYCTGFYFGDPAQTSPNLGLQHPSYAHRLVGRVVSVESDGTIIVDVRNRLSTGDRIEILSPGRPIQGDTLQDMTDIEGLRLPVAHAGMRVRLALQVTVGSMDIIRRRDPSSTAAGHR
jgi:putative protease